MSPLYKSRNYMKSYSGLLFLWSKIKTGFFVHHSPTSKTLAWAHFINNSSLRCWAINMVQSIFLLYWDPYLNNIRKANIHSLHIDSRQPAAVCVKCIRSEYKRQGKRRGVIVRVWVLYHHPSVRRGWLLMQDTLSYIWHLGT